jgi:hypothetical protein
MRRLLFAYHIGSANGGFRIERFDCLEHLIWSELLGENKLETLLTGIQSAIALTHCRAVGKIQCARVTLGWILSTYIAF